jgi:hypothetical protein
LESHALKPSVHTALDALTARVRVPIERDPRGSLRHIAARPAVEFGQHGLIEAGGRGWRYHGCDAHAIGGRGDERLVEQLGVDGRRSLVGSHRGLVSRGRC